MKLLLPLLALLTLPLHARDITLAWDANPPAEQVTRYYIEGFVGGVWAPLGQVVSPPGPVWASPPLEMVIPNFPDASTRVRAFAANAAGLVSEPSEELVVLPKPTPPGKLRIKVSLQKTVGSNGVGPWENLYVHEETALGASFFRTIVEPMTP